MSHHPWGRIRPDSVRQPFRHVRMAEEYAAILSRITGDVCWVEDRGFNWYLVLRMDASGKVGRG